MLTDESRETAISSLGWVDRGVLWVLRASEPGPSSVRLSDAEYLSLHAGRGERFSVGHHFPDGRFEVTIHAFDDVEEPMGGLRVTPVERSVWGDDSIWAGVQTSYTTLYAGPYWSDYCLVRALPHTRRVELQQFEWYGDAYDKMYQGIVGVVEIPGDDRLVVCVQRDSSPVLYDPVARRKVGQLRLADRRGNPTGRFRRHADELWIDDYDTILKLEPGTWRTVASRRLQDSADRTALFIGAYWLDSDETICVVARPYSSDVLGIDPGSLETVRAWETGAQPIEAVILADGRLVARDWRSGSLLEGRERDQGTRLDDAGG